MSTSHGDPIFCGNRQYAFTRTDTGLAVSDLFTETTTGEWHISATSSSYTAGSTLEIKVTVTLEHVDPSLLSADITFDLNFYSYQFAPDFVGDKIYFINNDLATYVISDAVLNPQVSDCNFSYLPSVVDDTGTSVNPVFIDFSASPNTWSVQSSILADRGTYILSVETVCASEMIPEFNLPNMTLNASFNLIATSVV